MKDPCNTSPINGPAYVQKSLGVLGVLGVFSSDVGFLSPPISVSDVFDFLFFFDVNNVFWDGDEDNALVDTVLLTGVTLP